MWKLLQDLKEQRIARSLDFICTIMATQLINNISPEKLCTFHTGILKFVNYQGDWTRSPTCKRRACYNGKRPDVQFQCHSALPQSGHIRRWPIDSRSFRYKSFANCNPKPATLLPRWDQESFCVRLCSWRPCCHYSHPQSTSLLRFTAFLLSYSLQEKANCWRQVSQYEHVGLENTVARFWSNLVTSSCFIELMEFVELFSFIF